MRKILAIILCLLSMGAMAQSAMKVMDEAASQIKKQASVKVNFNATTFEGNQEQGSMSGTMLLQGKKMFLHTEEMTLWYDGKTQWSLMQGTNEVNVTTPTAKEIAAINPYTFINHYKRGYKLTMKEAKLRGKDVYEVHMRATLKSLLAEEIYVDIDKASKQPMCIRIRHDNTWNRISIHSLQGGGKVEDSAFTFPKSEYTDMEIIDLR